MAKNPSSTKPAIQSDTVLHPSTEQRNRAVFTGQLNPLIKGYYSLALYDFSREEILPADDLDPVPGRSNFAEYFFTVPPKTHEFTEPFSTKVVPTQNGGKYIESHGSILKQIRLEGTTGLRPNPKRSSFNEIPLIGDAAANLEENIGTLTNVGQSLRNVDRSRTLDEDEPTGYDDIIFLRNLFRRYSDIKENDWNASNIVMIWRNAKDTDYWIVEPLDFRLTQSSSSPLTYNYSIQLKTLTRFNTSLNFPEDPLHNVLAARRAFSRIQEFNQAIKESYLIIAGQLTRLEGFGVFATNTVLDPLLSTLNGINKIKSNASNFGDRIKANAETAVDNINNAIDQIESSSRNDDDKRDILRTLRRTSVWMYRLLNEPSIQDNVGRSSEDRNRKAKAYNRGGTEFNRIVKSPQTGGSSSFLGNEPATENVAQDTVHNSETIRSAAGRLLGDRSRWHILVVINNLKYPYISRRGGTGVLKPGDRILYPSTENRGSRGQDVNAVNPGDDEEENKLGPVQDNYGKDIRLRSVPTSVGGVEYTDLVVGNGGDVSTIRGIDNVDQAIRLKFSTERGELPVHPRYGAKFPIGDKSTSVALNDFQIQAESTLFSDQRVENIKSVRFTQVGDSIVLNATLELIDQSDVLNTNLALRRL